MFSCLTSYAAESYNNNTLNPIFTAQHAALQHKVTHFCKNIQLPDVTK